MDKQKNEKITTILQSIKADIDKLEQVLFDDTDDTSSVKDNINAQKDTENKKNNTSDGITGYFDGLFMVGDNGKKYEVPRNYAAKSKLIYGDILSMILDEKGTATFKQIQKVPRKKIEGIVVKKGNTWMLLSDAGAYELSSTAAEFNNAKEHDEATALIPEDNTNVPFAALDEILVTKDSSSDKTNTSTANNNNKSSDNRKSDKGNTKDKSIDLNANDKSLRTLGDDDLR